MALVLRDRVKETSTTTGTGTLTLAGAATGFQSFSVIGNANTVYYAIVLNGANEWEIGLGTYTSSGTTLSRDTVLESSNSGSKVSFSAGAKEVFCTYPAEKAVTLDDVQTLSNKTLASPSVTGSITFSDASTQNTAATGFGFKNRIINGSMFVNQRNWTVTADLQHTVDRWRFGKLNDAVESVASSTDAPTGFTNSLKNTIGTADTSIGAGQYSNFKHSIEGYNVADLGFGTANAKSITLSFWVKSSLTGLYTGNICNSDESRICPFTYTIISANTWEYKTYTFTGDTSGTWLTNNGIGLSMYFYMALGSTYYNGTAGTWGSPLNYGAGGASLVNVLATAGNSFAITGVQIEKGTVATSFDYRPYGTELQLAQRYFIKLGSDGAPFAAFGNGIVNSSNSGQGFVAKLPVQMRTQPTVDFSTLRLYDGAAASAVTSFSSVSSCSNSTALGFDVACSATFLTAFRPAVLQGNNSTSAYVSASAEL